MMVPRGFPHLCLVFYNCSPSKPLSRHLTSDFSYQEHPPFSSISGINTTSFLILGSSEVAVPDAKHCFVSFAAGTMHMCNPLIYRALASLASSSAFPFLKYSAYTRHHRAATVLFWVNSRQAEGGEGTLWCDFKEHSPSD